MTPSLVERAMAAGFLHPYAPPPPITMEGLATLLYAARCRVSDLFEERERSPGAIASHEAFLARVDEALAAARRQPR